MKMSESKRKVKRRPIYVGDRNVFAVDYILQRRKIGTKTKYLIKWSGYPNSENSWVGELDVTKDLIKSFNLLDRERTPLATQTSNEQNQSIAVENNESYFEEGLHNFGVNVQLQSTAEDVQLFSSSECETDSSINRK